jgi:diphosphoinositol-polyphosphate diphosphatase
MVKEKPNQVRTYDKDGFRLRAACVCVRDDTEQEVLLVTTSRNRELWIVPGGGIEPTEDPRVAALREVHEEAGAKGILGRCLGVFENVECKTKTSVFVMTVSEVLDDWEDKGIGRQRKWFSLAEARHHLVRHRPTMCVYLDLLHKPAAEARVPTPS